MLDAGNLGLIVRAGAGYNTIDVAAASARGIYVSNCPGKNAVAVAELTMGLILALDRRIPDNVAELRAGRWNKKEYAKARGLYGSTLGILGLREHRPGGRAAGAGIRAGHRRLVAAVRRAAGSPDLAAHGLESTRDSRVSTAATPQAVAEVADILTVHLALGPTRAASSGRTSWAACARARCWSTRPAPRSSTTTRCWRPSATAACGSGSMSTRTSRPPGTAEFTMPLLQEPGVYGTHHIGASTEQAQEAIAAETVRIVRSFMETGQVPNVVNLARRTPATHMLVVRHRDRPGVLAHVFDHLSRGGLNVQETENIIFEGAEAAVARINLDGEPSAELLAAIEAGNDDILSLQLVAIQGA